MSLSAASGEGHLALGFMGTFTPPTFLLNKRFLFGLTVLGAAVILLLVISGAIRSGQNSSQAALIVQNAGQIKSALQYFYNDQERFPSASEYQDRNIMLSYFNYFPPQDFPSKVCPQTYNYKFLAQNQAEVDFCLPASLGSYRGGWNKILISE